MPNQKNKEELIQKVIEQISEDIHFHDHKALEELLNFTPIKYLIGYLPEEDWSSFKKIKEEEETKESIDVIDLISFLEYEEGYTVDPKSQKRIRTKLEELGVWKKNK
jgi:hypothetical protein